MRDLIVALIVFGSLPFILRTPLTGLLMWAWLGLMNPHRLAYGWAGDMPFAQIVVLCTLLSMFFNSKQLISFPSDRASRALILFVLWLGVSPLFSFRPELEFERWIQPVKVVFMALVALVIVGERAQLQKLLWVLVLSLAFFGIKGGIFTIASGGSFRVFGPGGAIADNNSLALALVMMIPLFRYLQMHTETIWIKRFSLAGIVLSAISAIGSQSRGAFLAMAAIGVFLWLKSRKKGLIGVMALAALPIAWLLMPEKWSERMTTIQNYEQDGSAMGRINAWITAWNVAVDRFPIGSGFAFDTADVYMRYAPDPTNVLVAHSIYFQILGQHGFVGLILFLIVIGMAWVNFRSILRSTKNQPNLIWAHDLAAMCQVSLIGYSVGGAFLNMTYFDLPYYIVVISVILKRLVNTDLETVQNPTALSKA
ncbi:MAG: putative O-glycosylation ligase, exosortase A system-associated [Gammaproteobacteria bacterium]|nr:putative O-glycosylation ligase, exosortase A system-associated [Gammaproteobacteria bacterium]MBU2435839.1 putative O-glycosylation ligase, exosortase A system-associated [Gammaproteobacteria bacterium]MBU2449380.1 putative O-glycosylation ligase, exosortase A system-associated [Gammaproteobacteria bacterium]